MDEERIMDNKELEKVIDRIRQLATSYNEIHKVRPNKVFISNYYNHQLKTVPSDHEVYYDLESQKIFGMDIEVVMNNDVIYVGFVEQG